MARDLARVVTVAQQVSDRLSTLGNFNLVPVVVPVADAFWFAHELAAKLDAVPYDFDAQVVAEMERRGWDRYRAHERAGIRGPTVAVLEAVASGVSDAADAGCPVLVHNVNTPAAYGFDAVADHAYRCSSDRHVVLCLGGSWQAGRIVLHDRMALMGAGLVQPIVVEE